MLVRRSAHGPEVAVVHRPHRSDWSLPKGKLEPGERRDAAAVREALEETGVRCVLGPSLGHRRYTVDGVPKRVHYWRATAVEVFDRPADDEVDEIRWLRRKAARALLTYDDDRSLLDLALGLPDTTPTIILRHAEAMKRAPWRESGDPLADLDSARPLNESGIDQAHELVQVLDAYGPLRIVSSDARRCRATVEPFASHRGLTTRLEHALSEEGFEDDPETTITAVSDLLDDMSPAVWCTHRPVLPIVIGALARQLRLDLRDDNVGARLDPRLRPGCAIVLHRAADGSVVAIDRFEA